MPDSCFRCRTLTLDAGHLTLDAGLLTLDAGHLALDAGLDMI